MIDSFGNEEQRKQFLPKLVTMEVDALRIKCILECYALSLFLAFSQHMASYCLTEPGAGSGMLFLFSPLFLRSLLTL
jgi:hypothetical protein